MRCGRADREAAVLGPHPRQLLDPFQVDQMAERREAELEQQEQLSPSAVEGGVLAVAVQ